MENIMKESTRQKLLEEISKPKGDRYFYQVADDLFRVYINNEFDNISHITDILHNELVYFVKENRDKFEFGKDSFAWAGFITELLKSLNYIDCYKTTWFKVALRENEVFAKIVLGVLDKNGTTGESVLEVGGGKIPYSSMLIADKKPYIHTMDNLLLANDCLARVNVIGHNEMFGRDSEITSYDMVVGQRACSAIENIVIRSVFEKKGYVLELCDCHSPDKSVEGYFEYLKSLDKDIHLQEVVLNNGTANYFRDKYSREYMKLPPSMKMCYIYNDATGITPQQFEDIVVASRLGSNEGALKQVSSDNDFMS